MHGLHADELATAGTHARSPHLLAGRPATVLLGDGDEDVHTMYSVQLEHRGYAVIHARSTAECLRIVHSRPVAAVLVSVGEGGLFGWKSYRSLARAARATGFALICFTTDPRLTTDPRRHRRCAAAVIMLPCTPEVVTAEVERAIARVRLPPN